MKRIIRGALLCAAIVTAGIVSAQKSKDMSVARGLNTFSSIVKELEMNYVDTINSETAFKDAIDAMLLMSVERRMGATAIADGQPWAGLVEEVLGRLSQHEAYRRVLPSAPFVSSRAISDLDIPAGVAWRDHVRDEQAPVPGAFGAPMASGSPAGRARDKADATEGASVSDDVMERLLGELDALYPDLDWLQDGEKDPSEGGGEDGAFGSGLFSEN